MKRTYEVRDRADKRAIREFLKREGQFLLPMLELVEQTEVAIAEVIQVNWAATLARRSPTLRVYDPRNDRDGSTADGG